MEDEAQVIIPAVAGPEGTLIPLSEAGYSDADSNIVAGIAITETGSLTETPQILVPAIFDENGNLIVLTDPYTVEEPQVYLPGIVDESGNIIALTEADAIAGGKFPLYIPYTVDESAGFGPESSSMALIEPNSATMTDAQVSSLTQLPPSGGKLYLPEPDSGAERADTSLLPQMGREGAAVQLPETAYEDRPQSSPALNPDSGHLFVLSEPRNLEEQPDSRDYPKMDTSTGNFTLPDAPLSENAATNFSGVPPASALPPLTEVDFGDRAQAASGQKAPAAASPPLTEADFGDRAQAASGQRAPAAVLPPLTEADFGDRAQAASGQRAPAAASPPLTEADFGDRAQAASGQRAPASALAPLTEADFGDRAQTASGRNAPAAASPPLTEVDFGDRAQTASGRNAPAAAIPPLTEVDFGDRAEAGTTAQPPASAGPVLSEVDMVDTPQNSNVAIPPSGSTTPFADTKRIERTQSQVAGTPPEETPRSAATGLQPQQNTEYTAQNYTGDVGQAGTGVTGTETARAGTEGAGISVEIYDTGIQPPQYGAGESQVAVSIPVIRQLDKGSYYIQLGIYGTAAALQEAVVQIPAAYPLLTQSLGNTAKSSYRLLVGPLNEGESNASLLYFRRYGYKDAFIRKN